MQCEFDASRLTRHGYIPSVCGISYHHIIISSCGTGMISGEPVYQHDDLGPQQYLDNPFVKVGRGCIRIATMRR